MRALVIGPVCIAVGAVGVTMVLMSSSGGLAGVKEEPAAAGRGARRRGTLLSILGFRVGVGRRRWWAVAWGSSEKKLGTGGLEGWPGWRWTGGGEWFRGGRGGAPPATGGGGRRFGRWWLVALGVGG